LKDEKNFQQKEIRHFFHKKKEFQKEKEKIWFKKTINN